MDLGHVREGWGEVSLPVAGFYERARPLLDETLRLCETLLAGHGGAESVYVTGGGSELPLVARVVREVYGKKVRRSPYTRAATAIGLAIQADDQAGYLLRERFTRHFGVWREAEGGALLVFDPIFPRGTALPGPKDPPLEIARRYQPVHNVGHFRYLESSHLAPNGWPTGDLAVWDEIRFPFDPALASRENLDDVPVVHRDGTPQLIEEHYSCDATGAVRVAIRNLTAGYERSYRLGRWAAKDAVLETRPRRKRR
jgi:molecular chaperone DnaK (HSP70)